MAWFMPRAFAFTRTNEKLYAPIAKIPITIRKVVYFRFRTFPAFLNMLVVFLRPPLSTTKHTSTTTAIEPGTSEMRNRFLIPIMGMRKKARMGPIMAPSWSSDRWRPKARPLTASPNGVAYQSVTWRGSNSLSSPISQPYCKGLCKVTGDRKERLGDSGKRVTNYYQGFPACDSIRDYPSKAPERIVQ